MIPKPAEFQVNGKRTQAASCDPKRTISTQIQRDEYRTQWHDSSVQVRRAWAAIKGAGKEGGQTVHPCPTARAGDRTSGKSPNQAPIECATSAPLPLNALSAKQELLSKKKSPLHSTAQSRYQHKYAHSPIPRASCCHFIRRTLVLSLGVRRRWSGGNLICERGGLRLVAMKSGRGVKGCATLFRCSEAPGPFCRLTRQSLPRTKTMMQPLHQRLK